MSDARMAATPNLPWMGSDISPMASRPWHRSWLRDQAGALIGFHARGAINPKGGFFVMDGAGRPAPGAGSAGPLRELHDSARIVHCYAAADLLGQPGAAALVDHGMRFLLGRHRDPVAGGFFWGVDDEGAPRPDKQAYGHAFALLAAASAGATGHPDAPALRDHALETIRGRFWDEAAGCVTEEYAADWSPLAGDGYRGQNSNMHMTEALMAAHETWEVARGERTCLDMALRIAARIIGEHARAQAWVVAEHFDARWQVDRDYAGDPMFRPTGTTPGHALEWSRLLIQLWSLDGEREDWLPEAARALFLRAVELGWNADLGGFHYTLDWQGRPSRRERYWWPCAEGAAAASVLGRALGDPVFELWYRRIWAVIDAGFIDHAAGGWWHEIDARGRPAETVFAGKPDIYHALQACLTPLVPPGGGVVAGLRAAAAPGR